MAPETHTPTRPRQEVDDILTLALDWYDMARGYGDLAVRNKAWKVIQAALTDRDRLRAALERIAVYAEHPCSRGMRDIARAALAAREP